MGVAGVNGRHVTEYMYVYIHVYIYIYIYIHTDIIKNERTEVEARFNFLFRPWPSSPNAAHSRLSFTDVSALPSLSFHRFLTVCERDNALEASAPSPLASSVARRIFFTGLSMSSSSAAPIGAAGRLDIEELAPDGRLLIPVGAVGDRPFPPHPHD